MKSDLLTLEGELDEISALINSHLGADALYPRISALGEPYTDIVEMSRNLLQGRTSQRKYQYISIIIALYGAMEQYVESMLLSYLRFLPKVCGRFDNIPEAIRLKHHDLSVEYMTAIKMKRVHEPEDVNVIVRRLAMCRGRAMRYELNSRAFTLRTANMSFDRMTTLAANMGISVTPRRLINSQSYQAFYLKRNGSEAPTVGDLEAKSVFLFVDDLVTRRNRIAHGVNSIDDIEDHSLLLDRVDHLRMYGGALHEVFEDQVIRLSAEKSRLQNLGVPQHKFRGNIVCFHLENGAIEVGDVVVMLPTDANFPARRGNAISLRVGTASHDRVVGGPDCHFGVKLPYNPSPTASYAILPSEIVGGLDL
ncbi:MAE_28990/MAE_18760 family HEPN-like nuclease [Tabrizicola aquatica]|uniref:MAE_28990/MAE_18760 family HEPN-like nuclease n=1 Tax=Tabrizicola aquatica TaxID=909926 RepID=UPI0011AF0FC6|nr:HEPN domain-containing protein [Tabrizicola aquatica]